MMENKKKALWLVGIGALILIAIIIFSIRAHREGSSPTAPFDTKTTDGSVLTPLGDLSRSGIHASVSPVPPGETKLIYDEALAKYAERTVQFGVACQAPRNNFVLKSPAQVLFDNRSQFTRTIYIGGIGTIALQPWDFQIVTLASEKLPVSVDLDCDGSQNVAVITLE